MEVPMKKNFLLCLCACCLLLTACGSSSKPMTEEQFEKYAATFKAKILAVDETLVIYDEISHAAQDGNYIKIYSIETKDKVCFGVTLTALSAEKAELLIDFTTAADSWNADNTAMFARLISGLSNANLQLDQIQSAVDSMAESDSYNFNKNAWLHWDDYHYTLYYDEDLSVDMNS